MSILIGMSPGRRSAAAVQYGELLARSLGQKLVTAAVTPRSWPATARPVETEWLAYADGAAHAVLDHAAATLSGDVAAEFVTHEASSVRRGLLDLVERYEARVLVLGSSTGGQIGRISLGSETDGMLHTSPVAVAIAPRGYRVARGTRIRQITVAHLGSESPDDIVDAGARLAATGGASLRLASFAVAPPAPMTARVGSNAEDAIRDEWQRQIQIDARKLLTEVPALAELPVSVDTAIGVGESWTSAVDEIGWEPDDVLVVGSSGLGPITRVFIGSRASKLIRHSPVPVIVIPRGRTDVLALEGR